MTDTASTSATPSGASTAITQAIERITAEIRQLELRHAREPGSVQLLAVSKTKPIEAVLAAISAGQLAFGENYLEEAVQKIEAAHHAGGEASDCQWHFIGGIQSRKTAAIAEHFDWVHSVDRLKIAQRLSNQRPDGLPPLNICLQVNLDREAGKSGVDPDELAALFDAVRSLPRLRVRGLMAIPAPRNDVDEQHIAFRALRELLNTLQLNNPDLDTLSMGMSGDLEAAIAEGATIVRIGTAIFGARN